MTEQHIRRAGRPGRTRRAGQWAPVVLVFALAMGATSSAEAARSRSVTERVFPFPAAGVVSIESQNGRIVVEAWDRREVRVQITREARAKNEERARAIVRELAADVSVGPSRIEIVSHFPKKSDGGSFWDRVRGGSSAGIHYYVQIPKGTSLELRTSNGPIRVRGSEAPMTGATSNGSVEVTSARGPIEVATSNGEVRLSRVSGTVQASTSNGSVTAEITSLPGQGRLDLQTTNGNLRLSLPRELHADLDAITTNGRVRVAYETESPRAISSRAVQARIGGGGVRVKLQTTNGNIDVAPVSGGR